MNYLFQCLIAYPIGIILTLIFLKYFGELIGINFKTVDKDNFYQAIWTNKIGTYTSLAIIWPIFFPILIFVSTFKLIIFIVGFFLIKPIYWLIRKVTIILIKENDEIEPW